MQRSVQRRRPDARGRAWPARRQAPGMACVPGLCALSHASGAVHLTDYTRAMGRSREEGGGGQGPEAALACTIAY
jgi:hypothetical protein